MNIVDKKQSDFEKKYYAGLEKFKIIKVNPTLEEKCKLYDREPRENEKETDYVTIKENVDTVRISIYMEAIDTDRIVSKTFFIENNPSVSRDGAKTQYINSVCQSTWVDSEENLPTWFTDHIDFKTKLSMGKKTYRVAKKGEVDLYEFFKNVTQTKVDYRNTEVNIDFKFVKLLRGEFNDINTYFTNPNYVPPFYSLNFIKNTLTPDGETKSNNEVYTKVIIPERLYNTYYSQIVHFYEEFLNDQDFLKSNDIVVPTITSVCGYLDNPNFIMKNEYDRKALEYIFNSTKGEYGCKGFFKLAPVFEYKANMDITSSNNVFSDSDTSY
jgi:hypothetical protein